MSSADRVTVTTVVAVEPELAFQVFTEQIDSWWKRGPRYWTPDDQSICFEPGPAGRLVLYKESGDVFEVGRVLDWKPPERLRFEWRARQFAPDELTEVDVRFQPVDAGTRVTLEHSGWNAIPEDHVVRHGHTGEAFRSLYGLWWGDLLVSLRRAAEAR